PPSSTRCPYTTLFRSPPARRGRDRRRQVVRLPPARGPARLPAPRGGPGRRVDAHDRAAGAAPPQGPAVPPGGAAARVVGGQGRRDRKSTRLNSSHVKI